MTLELLQKAQLSSEVVSCIVLSPKADTSSRNSSQQNRSVTSSLKGSVYLQDHGLVAHSTDTPTTPKPTNCAASVMASQLSLLKTPDHGSAASGNKSKSNSRLSSGGSGGGGGGNINRGSADVTGSGNSGRYRSNGNSDNGSGNGTRNHIGAVRLTDAGYIDAAPMSGAVLRQQHQQQHSQERSSSSSHGRNPAVAYRDSSDSDYNIVNSIDGGRVLFRSPSSTQRQKLSGHRESVYNNAATNLIDNFCGCCRMKLLELNSQGSNNRHSNCRTCIHRG